MRFAGDLRFSLRRLASSPAFTLAAVASLALGIGATTAIYSIVHTLLVRPLAGIAEPERLVDIGRTDRGEGFDTVGYADLVDYRANVKSLDQLFGWSMDPFHVRVGAASVRVLGYAVSANYFEALGVRPAAGRFFLAEEDSQKGGAAVAVVSHDFFERQLAGDASRIGTVIRVDSRPFTLVGVTPPAFQGHIFGLHPEVFVPLSTALSDAPWETTGRLTSRRSAWLILGGRLAPGATLVRVQAELDGVSAQLAKAYPDSHAERGARALAMKPVPGPGRTPVALFSTLLFALVGFVLAIACMNVASMLLARAEERQREIAVRQALGAPSRRIVRQLLAESALLFLLAVPPGLLLARWGVDLLAAFRPPTPFPVTLEFPVDWSAALFATAVSLATGILFGLAPALQAARRAPLAALHDGAAGSGTRQLRLRRVLVGAQLALSLLLLVTAGLLLRALGTAQRIDPGFRAEGVVAYEFNFDIAGYSGEAARGELARLIEGARTLPGVTGASASMSVPLDLNRIGLGGVEVDGIQSPSQRGFEVDANIVAPGFFATLGIPVEGRDFDATDVPGDSHVAIVNDSFAKRFFPTGALDRTFYLRDGEPRVPYRIVGVARDIRHFSLGEAPVPFFWAAASQSDLRRMNLLVRTSGNLASTTRAVETMARGLDPDLPPGPPQSLPEVAATSTLPQRLAATVAGSVGAVGLFLAAVGLYGVVAFVVAARRRELAVRIALGAERRDVIRFVLADAARPVVVGSAVGLALSFALSRLLSSLLYGLSPTDLVTFAGVPVLLGLVALVAVAIPARRAAAIDPAAALRSD